MRCWRSGFFVAACRRTLRRSPPAPVRRVLRAFNTSYAAVPESDAAYWSEMFHAVGWVSLPAPTRSMRGFLLTRRAALTA